MRSTSRVLGSRERVDTQTMSTSIPVPRHPGPQEAEVDPRQREERVTGDARSPLP
jgi:hypothetical protein